MDGVLPQLWGWGDVPGAALPAAEVWGWRGVGQQVMGVAGGCVSGWEGSSVGGSIGQVSDRLLAWAYYSVHRTWALCLGCRGELGCGGAVGVRRIRGASGAQPRGHLDQEQGWCLQLTAPHPSPARVFPPGGRPSRALGTGPARAQPSGTSCAECR